MILFEVSGHRLVVPAERVIAVAGPESAATLSDSKRSMVGALRRGANVVPILDLSFALGLGALVGPRPTCLLLRTGRDFPREIAVLTTNVEGSCAVERAWSLPPLATSSARCIAGVAAVAGELVLVLDPSRLHELLDAQRVRELLTSAQVEGGSAW